MEKKRGLPAIGLWVIAGMLIMMQAGQAHPITFNFTGHVVWVQGFSGATLDGSITSAGGGTPISGSYTFDSAASDSNWDPTVGDYWHGTAGYGIVVKMGSYTFRTDPNNVRFLVEVCNDRPNILYPTIDNYLLRSYMNVTSAADLFVEHISWQLDDDSGKALTTDALPLFPPVLSQWQQFVGFGVMGCSSPIFPWGGCLGSPSSFFIRAVIDSVTPAVMNVPIDIHPGGLPNSINPKSRGTTPVAILSSSEFNAFAGVDKTSLTFGRTGAENSLAFCNASPQDVNGDGLPDMVCHFDTQKTGFRPGDIQGILKGMTVTGTPITGVDSVRIVP